MLNSHNPHAHKAELWGEERTHQPWRQSTPEDFSVRAGSQHQNGPTDTQRGNLTDGGHPGQAAPVIHEHQSQPASPDTVHAKLAKVRLHITPCHGLPWPPLARDWMQQIVPALCNTAVLPPLNASLGPSFARDWLQQLGHALCNTATLQLMDPSPFCLQISESLNPAWLTPALCFQPRHAKSNHVAGPLVALGTVASLLQVKCHPNHSISVQSFSLQPAVPEGACIVSIHCSPEHASFAMRCTGSNFCAALSG